jgi:tRNA A-37 threonylcarbamoyl transferase component Bud32
MQDVGEKSMFKWKTAEKLEQPKITEVIAEEELSATTIVEEVAPAPLPVAQLLAAVGKNSIEAECTNSIAEAQIPVALPPKELSADPGTAAAAQKPEHAETPPELGDRYEVLEFIGSGGMGSVWKVYDKQLDGTFAVKVLKPELLADATAVKRFEKEANLASDLTHANIAAIFGPGTDSQGRPFIIMGYVDGESLADILACEGKLSEERALDIFTQICEALSHSHMKGIIHRDIKPSNIIISKTESGGDMVNIVDFGIARCIYDEVTKTQALTKAVDIFGSPRYMSPEQFLGNNVTGQSDIYSLGCVFYEMLTGAPPFTDENPVKLILQHISETPDLSKVPQRLQCLVYECLTKEPEIRAPNVDSLLERIAGLGSNLFVNGQPTTLIHCMLAVVIILCLGCTEVSPATSGFAQPFGGSFVVLFLWLYVVVVNRDNAGRSINYKILELNLFLATIAGAIADCLALTHIAYINMLATPFMAGLSLFLILQPKVVAAYSKCTSTVSSLIMSCESRLYSKHEKFIQKVGLTMVHALLVLLSFIAATDVFFLVLIRACGVDIASPVAMSNFMFLVSTFVFFSFVIVLVRLLLDFSTCKRSVRQSLGLSMKLQAAVFSFVVLVTVSVTSTVGRGGFNLLVRQCFQSYGDKRKEEQLRLEALSYPDTLLANQARLMAASCLWGISGRNSDALALGQQIIESKREKEPATLAAAYVMRFRIREVKGQSGGDPADLYKAISLLEGAQRPSLTDLESSLFGIVRPLEAEVVALSVGVLALNNNDLGLSKRALKLVKSHMNDNRSFLERDIRKLQAGVAALSASKPPSAVDRR